MVKIIKKHFLKEKIQKFYTTRQQARIFQNHNLSCNTISNQTKPIQHNKKLNTIIKMTLKATQSTNNFKNNDKQKHRVLGNIKN